MPTISGPSSPRSPSTVDVTDVQATALKKSASQHSLEALKSPHPRTATIPTFDALKELNEQIQALDAQSRPIATTSATIGGLLTAVASVTTKAIGYEISAFEHMYMAADSVLSNNSAKDKVIQAFIDAHKGSNLDADTVKAYLGEFAFFMGSEDETESQIKSALGHLIGHKKQLEDQLQNLQSQKEKFEANPLKDRAVKQGPAAAKSTPAIEHAAEILQKASKEVIDDAKSGIASLKEQITLADKEISAFREKVEVVMPLLSQYLLF